MAQKKTPGVYIVEQNAFPNSVVEVPTAIPVFLGYTETALRGSKDMTGIPVRVTSMTEIEQIFGGPANETFSRARDGTITSKQTRRYLYPALRMFFANGGGPCWIVSLGGYDTPAQASDTTEDIWQALRKEPEPALILSPDAVTWDFAGYMDVAKRMLAECAFLQSRFAVFDLHGDAGPGLPARIKAFRSAMADADGLQYGALYAPWLNSTAMAPSGDDMQRLDLASRKILKDAIESSLPDEFATAMQDSLSILVSDAPKPDEMQRAHKELSAKSRVYNNALTDLRAAINLVPPSGAIAGIMAQTDANVGVWKAPANVSLANVVSPAEEITNAMQEDMNVPLDGLAVNAIRSFIGRGTLVWGARTLDGNSLEWRYVSVRRTLIMLEQSIKLAAAAYVFAPNDAGTWATVKSMIGNFLNNQWKAGALAGATPEEAYDVAVGLGETMTGSDILNGYMNVTVHVAVTRPAEFLVLTFQQKMQTS